MIISEAKTKAMGCSALLEYAGVALDPSTVQAYGEG